MADKAIVPYTGAGRAVVAWRPLDNQIYHMDALMLLRAMPDDSVDMVLSDMPYGITACEWDTVPDLAAWWAEVERIVKPRCPVVLTASQPFTSELVMSRRSWFRYEWIWNKTQATGHLNAYKMPMRSHESILVFSKEFPRYYPVLTKKNPRNIRPVGRRAESENYGAYHEHAARLIPSEVTLPTSVLRVPNVNRAELAGHPTQKPIALFEYLIKTYTLPDALVVDMYMGSGTTALAARNTGRRYVGCDISREYVDIARRRLRDSDPYRATIYPGGQIQKSLFEGVG